MALQIKMNMAENGVQAPRSTGDVPLDSTALDARDVAAFAGMMKQSGGKLNDSTANFSAPSTTIFDGAQDADVVPDADVTQYAGVTQVTADTHCVDMASLFTMPKKADANIPDVTSPDAKIADAKTDNDLADLPSPATLASLASSLITSPSSNDATALTNLSSMPSKIATTPSNVATMSASEHGADDADTMYLVQDTAPNAQMAALLASMNGALQASAMQNPVAPVVTEIKNVTAPHFTAKEIDAMVTMLVDRIAVSDVKAHMVTVEISLADTALRGTTVHLTRSLDGLLAVNVITNDAATFQTLVGAQIDLRTKLESLDLGMVRVDISHNPQDQEREQNRRSAMYQEYVGDDDHA